MRILPILLAAMLLTGCSASCEQLSFSHEGALNVLFFQDGLEKGEWLFREQALFAKDAILTKEPFTNRPYMNFYLIHNKDSGICKEGAVRPTLSGECADHLRPLECDIERVKELASMCGVEKGKIIILTNETVAAQTSISYDESGVMFLDMKNQQPEIIQHEFAHLFGLVDEKAKLYSYAYGPGMQPAPNCVTNRGEAESLWAHHYEIDHEFARGCSGHPDWWTPERPTLLSRLPDPSWEYGVFNTWYLEKALDCCYAAQANEGCGSFFAEYPQWADCRGGNDET